MRRGIHPGAFIIERLKGDLLGATGSGFVTRYRHSVVES